MTLNKKIMVREVSRRTGISNREVQQVIEALVDVWTEELVAGGRIELENFMVLETKMIDRGANAGKLKGGDAPRYVRRVVVRGSRKLKGRLNCY
jgi:nucleoid DNA-binding protein